MRGADQALVVGCCFCMLLLAWLLWLQRGEFEGVGGRLDRLDRDQQQAALAHQLAVENLVERLMILQRLTATEG